MGVMSGWEFFCALLLYPTSVIDTHLKLKFIQLKSMDGKSIECHLGLGLGKVIVNLNRGLISTSASSFPVLHLLPISGSPVLFFFPFLVLHLHHHLRSCSSLELKSLRLKFYVAKLCPSHQSELEFESLNFRHRSQVFKTRNASFQISFSHMLTYYIFSPHCANLQNPS